MLEREIANKGHPVNGGRCTRCSHDRFTIGEGRNLRGMPTYPFVCSSCEYVEAQYAGQKLAEQYVAKFGPLQRVMTTTERGMQQGRFGPTESMSTPCEVCGTVGDAQEHHWAPWHLFGEEANSWPKSWLCQACHTRWHQIVTPNMSSPRD